MTVLLDTQILLWAVNQPARLPAPPRALLKNPDNDLLFSSTS